MHVFPRTSYGVESLKSNSPDNFLFGLVSQKMFFMKVVELVDMRNAKIGLHMRVMVNRSSG